MLKAKSMLLVSALMLGASTVAHAQTIDELTDAARAKKLTELRKDSAPAAAGAGSAQPPVMPSVSATGKAGSESGRKRTIQTEPYLLSIYGVGNRLVAEIAEDNAEARYKLGEKTDSGWTIAAIHERDVVLKKYDKAGKSTATKTLSFWTPMDSKEPADKDQANRTNLAGAGPLPPYPPVPPVMPGR